MKIVINACYGGFNPSEALVQRYAQLKGLTLYPERSGKYGSLLSSTYWLVPPGPEREDQTGFYEWPLEQRAASNARIEAQMLTPRDIKRDDPLLVQAVEELGPNASGPHSTLKIVEIPDDVEWQIEEYDGNETVAEVHRTWS